MSATTLYKALIEAKVSEETAEKAVEDLEFARDVATKADLQAGLAQLRAEIAQLESRIDRRFLAAVGVLIAAMGVVKKFL